MKVEAKYRDGLKALMKTTSLDEINVVMLCNAVKSNRQTFYYHYRDISDVIESMFLKEKVGYGVRIFSFDNIIKPLIAYINANTTFLVAVANSFASDKLVEFFYSYFYQRCAQLFKHLNKEAEYTTKDLNTALRCISTLMSKEMFFWIMNKSKERQLLLQKRLNGIWNYFSERYLIELKNLKWS